MGFLTRSDRNQNVLSHKKVHRYGPFLINMLTALKGSQFHYYMKLKISDLGGKGIVLPM